MSLNRNQLASTILFDLIPSYTKAVYQARSKMDLKKPTLKIIERLSLLVFQNNNESILNLI